MKRFFCIIFALVIAFSLSACDTSAVIEGLENLAELELPELPQVSQEPAADSSEEIPEDTAQPDVQTVELPGKVIVSLKKTNLSHYAPDDAQQLILSFNYDTPIVSIEGNDNAAHLINDFTAYLEEEHYTGMEEGEFTGFGYYGMLEQAEDNYRYVHDSGAELDIEFSSSRAVDVLRADSSILSLVYSDYVYTGGAKGTSLERAYVFSTETGLRLSIDELAQDSQALKELLLSFMVEAAYSDEKIRAAVNAELIPNGDYEAAFSTLLREGSWYLATEGLVIFSDAGEFSHEEQGSLRFVVPYSLLNGVISNNYMPQYMDSPCTFSLTEKTAEGTEIYDMVNVDEDGQVFYLVIEGMANQLKVASVMYADSFFETAEHWYGSYAGNCAIQICANIPEGMPNLMISCIDIDGVTHNMLVSQSGVDGKLILTDDNIEAVG